MNEVRKADSKGRVALGIEHSGKPWDIHWQDNGSILMVPVDQTVTLREPAKFPPQRVIIATGLMVPTH